MSGWSLLSSRAACPGTGRPPSTSTCWRAQSPPWSACRSMPMPTPTSPPTAGAALATASRRRATRCRCRRRCRCRCLCHDATPAHGLWLRCVNRLSTGLDADRRGVCWSSRLVSSLSFSHLRPDEPQTVSTTCKESTNKRRKRRSSGTAGTLQVVGVQQLSRPLAMGAMDWMLPRPRADNLTKPMPARTAPAIHHSEACRVLPSTQNRHSVMVSCHPCKAKLPLHHPRLPTFFWHHT